MQQKWNIFVIAVALLVGGCSKRNPTSPSSEPQEVIPEPIELLEYSTFQKTYQNGDTLKVVVGTSYELPVLSVQKGATVRVDSSALDREAKGIYPIQYLEFNDSDSVVSTIYVHILPLAVSEISIQGKSFVMAVGGTVQLQASVLLNNDEVNKEVQWEIENTEVAQISPQGVVVARKEGRALVRVSSKMDTSFSSVALVKVVSEEFVPAVKFIDILDSTQISLPIGGSQILSAIMELETGERTDVVTWKSMNPEVIQLDVSKGYARVTALKSAGVAKIRAISPVDSTQYDEITIQAVSTSTGIQKVYGIEVSSEIIGVDKVIQIKELLVFNKNNLSVDVTDNGVLTGSPSLNGSLNLSNANNGNTGGGYFHGKTNDPSLRQYVKVMFTSPVTFENIRVQVYGRTNCCKTRANGVFVSLLGENGTPIVTSEPSKNMESGSGHFYVDFNMNGLPRVTVQPTEL